ncbi:hypothetical protein C0995_004441 [Termitomyces sp. Mi166|nr:hypothetical protein C0995_004441 [Termitomyces sp. Mi166\
MRIFAILLALLYHATLTLAVGESLYGSFDFVIIGGKFSFLITESAIPIEYPSGGTAGNVVANRLTENPENSVLVLEAGPSEEGILDSEVPLFCTRLTPDTPFDWNFTTVPQVGLNGRSVPYARGKLLGGSSSVNYMGYTRGSMDDYDRYAQMTGEPGWSWDRLQVYFRKNEKWTRPADNHNTTGQFDPSVHGFHGINSVSLPGFQHEIDRRVIQTTSEMPEEFPFNIDMNSGHQLGIGELRVLIKRSNEFERSSSATSYLGPEFLKRKNLHVLLQAQVSRICSTTQGEFDFKVVEFTQGVDGRKWQVTAKKEVILSAGTIGTPHILLNSGIGNSSTLSLLGIKPLVHLPSVGQNLSDHPLVTNEWLVNSTDTLDTLNRNSTLMEEALRQWNKTRTGPLVVNIFNNLGWIRLPSNASIFSQFQDPSAGPHTAHFELIFTNGLTHPPVPESGNFLSVITAMLCPLSRGSVTINSTNPFDPPVIDPGLLSSNFDIAIMREAIRSARRFIAAPAWSNYTISLLSNATTDAELDEYIRNNAASIFHPVGTAAMSPEGADYGVVDPDLRVKGVTGLRVVDASVLPVVPAGHTQAATYVFAERASDLIKEFWKQR